MAPQKIFPQKIACPEQAGQKVQGGFFAQKGGHAACSRIGEELLRIDPAHHLFGLRLNFYVASILFLAGVGWFLRTQRARLAGSTGKTVRRGGALLAAGGLLVLAGCGHASRAAASPAHGLPSSVARGASSAP